jgi:hypothetical protein
MIAGLLTDVAERFPLRARNGIVTPTAEPVSDTAVTPFGLTLRTIPARDNVVHAGTSRATGTDQVTLIETDGRADSSDTDSDYTTDSDQESD